MTRTAKSKTAASAFRLRDVDLSTVRKQRDKHVTGGGAWQSWQRILDTLEDAKLAQDAIAATETERVDDVRAGARLEDWIATGGTV